MVPSTPRGSGGGNTLKGYLSISKRRVHSKDGVPDYSEAKNANQMPYIVNMLHITLVITHQLP